MHHRGQAFAAVVLGLLLPVGAGFPFGGADFAAFFQTAAMVDGMELAVPDIVLYVVFAGKAHWGKDMFAKFVHRKEPPKNLQFVHIQLFDQKITLFSLIIS